MTEPESEPVDIVPFEMLTQKEQYRHLQTHHIHPWTMNSKSRKQEMQDWHAKSHVTGHSLREHRAHTHTATPVASQGPDGAPLDLTKPLNQSQRKALKDLVENDFLALKAEINQFANDMAKARRDEVRAEYAARGADQTAFLARGRDLMQAYRTGVDQLILDARKAGVDLTMPSLYSREIEAKVTGLSAALTRAVEDVEADRQRALNSLERARLTAQRKVLMTGVTEESLAILESIPDARTLMLQAATERANPQIATQQPTT